MTQISPQVLVVMAVYRPDPDHLAAQFASLAAQSHPPARIFAVIADQSSEALVQTCARDCGLPLSAVMPQAALDAPRAFEAGIRAAVDSLDPGDTRTLIALCDQDDLWHPARIERGVAALDAHPAIQLVHSDARLVADDGHSQVAPSMFRFEHRHPAPGLRGLLYRNTITGMTTLFRARLARIALPFPAQSGVHYYHDLWLGLLAEATGGVHLIREALVDYRQHAGNTIGAVDRSAGPRRILPRKPDMITLRKQAAPYALARYLAHSVQARLNEAALAGLLPSESVRIHPIRAYLRHLRGAGTHVWDMLRLGLSGRLTLARIAGGHGLVNLGRLVWTTRRALSHGLNEAVATFDTRLYTLSPGITPESPRTAPSQPRQDKHKDLIDQRKDPAWTPDFSAPAPSLTILVPTLNPTEIFAGIATAVDIGLGLVKRGFTVRFIATDLPIGSAETSRAFLIRRLGADAPAGLERRIHLACGVSEPTVPAHKDDLFLATAWWSAHVADRLIRRHGFAQSRFFYLIQDFEPNFYPWGQEFADAMASYALPFTPIFNTTLLREYFAEQGFDFASKDRLAFRPSIDITHYANPARATPDPGAPLKLALYGRPEVARNMFPTAIEALARFAESAALDPRQIQMVSVGLKHPPVTLPRGLVLTSLGKLPWEDYPDFLRGVDLGLSLMYSPHPSHPPIEMAASGVRVVTNRFGPKDLSQLSPAIRATEATAPALAEALQAAWTEARSGPLRDAQRQLDLAPLGLAMPQMLDRLASDLSQYLVPEPPDPAPTPTPTPAPALAAPTHTRPPQRIVLHIGLPKCGSTFLQHALRHNADVLAEAGVLYPPGPDDHPSNGGAIDQLTRADVAAYFDSGAHTVFLSYENLLGWGEKGKPLAAIAREMGIEVQLLAFLRPFPDIIFADYSQYLKEHFETYLAQRSPYDGLDFKDFTLSRSPVLTVAAFLTSWQNVIPAPKVLLAPHTDIEATLTRLLNLPGSMDWNIPKSRRNLSLRVEDCDAVADAIRDPAQSPEAVRALFEAAHQNVLNPAPDTGRTEARRAMIDKIFRPHNGKLLEKFSYDNRAAEPARGSPPE